MKSNTDSYNISIRGTNTLDHISSLKKFTDSNNKFNLIYQYYFNDIDYLNKKIIGPQLKTSDNFVDRILKKTFMWIVDSSYFFDYLLTPIAIKILSSKFDESLIFDESLYEKHLDDLKKIFEFTNKKNGKVIFIIFPILEIKIIMIFQKMVTSNFLNKTFINFVLEMMFY